VIPTLIIVIFLVGSLAIAGLVAAFLGWVWKDERKDALE
jgi:hypothetical protein